VSGLGPDQRYLGHPTPGGDPAGPATTGGLSGLPAKPVAQ